MPKENNKTISVIVPVYIRNKTGIAMTIKSIDLAKSMTRIPFELVIVETCSDYFKDICDVHIFEKEKTTATISSNRGFKAARGDYKVFFTNDVFVRDGWLESLLECFNIKDCGASTLGSTQFNHQKEHKIEEGNWFSVAMIPQKIFDEVGYFDEEYTGVFDDTDLLLRIYKTGRKMYRNFNSIADHLIRATHGDNPENFNKNRELYNRKHAGCILDFFNQTR